MKQKDATLILVMVFVAAVVAVLVSKWVFSSPGNSKQTAEVVDVITDEFPPLPPKYFNSNSVNPTQQIEIGGTNNPNPFNAKPQ